MSKDKKRKKKHRVLKAILTFLVIFLVLLGGFVSYSTLKNGWGWQGLLATMMGHNQETVEDLDEFKILLMGVSEDISSKLTDTIMVASYNPKTQQAALLSIPRDTFVGKSKANANSYDKINALYQTGPENTLKAVNEITGLDIKYYAVINNNALIEVVDAIGGVEFNVPIDMKYDDPTQDLHINLKAGVQKLDGAKAEQLLRFRHNNDGSSYDSEYGDNDIGRMKTQREFMTTVAKQTIQLKNVMKIGELLDIVYDNLETNTKLSDVKDYLPYAIEFNTDNIKTDSLPGEVTMLNKLSFFEYDEEETQELIQEMFYSTETTTEDEQTENTGTTNVTTTQASQIKIELLNGSGNSRKLTNATNLLKQKGYNVYKTGTTKTTPTTTIINNTDVDSQITTNIKELLEIGTISSTATSSKSTANVTIIIGEDF